MKALLNPDDFHYYLMASVDICVISTQDFLPKFGFELDSHFHDEEKQKIRDERKNRIFITANLPLYSSQKGWGRLKRRYSQQHQRSLKLDTNANQQLEKQTNNLK